LNSQPPPRSPPYQFCGSTRERKETETKIRNISTWAESLSKLSHTLDKRETEMGSWIVTWGNISGWIAQLLVGRQSCANPGLSCEVSPTCHNWSISNFFVVGSSSSRAAAAAYRAPNFRLCRL
jgi:hypothetical protein